MDEAPTFTMYFHTQHMQQYHLRIRKEACQIKAVTMAVLLRDLSLLILVSLFVCYPDAAVAFSTLSVGSQLRKPNNTPTSSRRSGISSRSTPTTTYTSLAAGKEIKFAGDAQLELFIPSSNNSNHPDRNLPAFLRSPDSDAVVLGTPTYKKRADGLWDCPQPRIEWFGLDLVPVFVNEIIRPKNVDRVVSKIIEARTDIAGGNQGNRAKAIATIMKRSTFEGLYALDWQQKQRGNAAAGWTLRANLQLVLIVELPLFVPLPPGFNTIGSRIVQATCQKRVEESLTALRDEYVKWAKM